MPLYRVTVENRRESTFYVIADDEGAAREDADELAADLRDLDWDEDEQDNYVRETAIPADQHELRRQCWTGFSWDRTYYALTGEPCPFQVGRP